MTPRLGPLTLLTLALWGLTLSACGGVGSDTTSPVDDEPADSSESAGTPAAGNEAETSSSASSDNNDSSDDRAGESAESEEGEPLSPLGAYLGYPIPGIDGAGAQEERRIYMDALAACMQAQGFPYVSWVPGPEGVIIPVEEGLDPESREFAAKYGFGISTQFFSQDDVGPGLLGYTGPRNALNLDADPNHAIRQTLTPEEREAYDRAYFGADSPFFDQSNYDEEAEGVPIGWAISTHGCVGEGERALSGDAFDLMSHFAAEIVALPTKARADRRFLDHIDAVERCVHEAGYDFYAAEPEWAVLAHFDDLVAEVDRMVGEGPLAGLTETELGAMSPEEIEALYEVPRFLTPSAKDRLAEIQDLEAATAVTAWDCGANQFDQRRVLDEITADLQTDFIDEHGDALEPFRR